MFDGRSSSVTSCLIAYEALLVAAVGHASSRCYRWPFWSCLYLVGEIIKLKIKIGKVSLDLVWPKKNTYVVTAGTSTLLWAENKILAAIWRKNINPSWAELHRSASNYYRLFHDKWLVNITMKSNGVLSRGISAGRRGMKLPSAAGQEMRVCGRNGVVAWRIIRLRHRVARRHSRSRPTASS